MYGALKTSRKWRVFFLVMAWVPRSSRQLYIFFVPYNRPPRSVFADVTICGPLFTIGDPIVIGPNNVVVPDGFFKSVLAEKAKPDAQNQLELWTFAIPKSIPRNLDRRSG